MILPPKNPRDLNACFHCGQPAEKKPGYAAMCDPCTRASDSNLPRNIEILETLAKIATQCPSLRIGQILANVMNMSNKELFYVSDSDLHASLKRFLRNNA